MKYSDLDHLGIDITNLKFETAPERDWEWVREDMFHKNYLDGKMPAVKNNVILIKGCVQDTLNDFFLS